ncbi:MAG: hypothetical protein Q4C37_05830 [Bacteroidales bacterium]|nr:hypothetical protein [Bacteroidales bacterium]
MDTNEKKQEIENKAFQEMREEGRLKEEGRLRKEEGTNRSSRLWIWLGVLVLVFILIYWLFAIGTFGDLQNWFNG